jgi:regulator of cell morphogenesis and NO signaling
MDIKILDTVGSIVTQNIGAAKILDRYGIDFCCGGSKTLVDACQEKNIRIDDLLEELTSMKQNNNELSPNFDAMKLDDLTHYIENFHHKYTSESILFINAHMNKLILAHGINHPDLEHIKMIFDDISDHLTIHMKREELMLFPYIQKIVRVGKDAVGRSVFGEVEKPISGLMDDHEVEGERFRRLQNLTNYYTVPPDGCNTFKATYAAMKELETDLHIHIHLENNILFPKALALEKEYKSN